MERRYSPKMNDNYKTFGLMLLISFCIMYAVMFLNVNNIGHVFLSITRFYMSVLMVSPMAILMLTLMKMMYRNKKLNQLIYFTASFTFVLALFLLRSQIPIGDTQYMKAMIPHHSSAIMTSTQADILDPEVKALSEKIIRSQQEEIAQMKAILKRMR
jgi:FtsH-binding integral membrane protein